MRFVYYLIVLYLTAHFIFYLFREKNFWKRVSVALILILFILRLFLVK
jgi:hypothetical protein